MTWSSFLDPVAFGIAAGLFIGKQIGIFGTIWLAVKAGLSPKPSESSWIQIYGMAVLCGIGFTMSLFIGTLAFGDQSYAAPIRLGVLTGSVVSAVVGYILLRAFTAKAAEELPQRA
jgi:NhaA family Na+:H+ antiporter